MSSHHSPDPDIISLNPGDCRNLWLGWSRYPGFLAPPFDIGKYAIATDGDRRDNDSLSGSTRAESAPSEDHDQGLLNPNITAGDAVQPQTDLAGHVCSKMFNRSKITQTIREVMVEERWLVLR